MEEEKTRNNLRRYFDEVNDFSEEHRIRLRENVINTYESISPFIDYSG